MNKAVEKALIFVGGGICGSAITYFVLKKKNNAVIDKIVNALDEESDDMRKRIHELQSYIDDYGISVEINPKSENPSKEAIDKIIDISEKAENDYEKAIGIPGKRRTRYSEPVDYTNFSSDLDDELEPDAFEHPEDDPPIDPYIISEEEFIAEQRNYSKVYLAYYAKDGIFVDERTDEMIDDISGNLGDISVVNYFGTEEDPDMIHIRNDNRGMDFEISRVNQSYHEDILGIYEEET